MEEKTKREMLISLLDDIFTSWKYGNNNPNIDFLNKLQAYNNELSKYEIPSSSGALFLLKDLFYGIAFEYFYNPPHSTPIEKITENLKISINNVLGSINQKDTIVEYNI